MYRKDVNAQSPLRILEKSIHGGLGKGNLGVVLAQAGVGKSACLVQIGLDDLLRERNVLHLAMGQTVDHVSAWYDVLFDDLAEATHLEERDEVRGSIARHRFIQAFPEGPFTPQRLEKALAVARELKLEPATILVDGFDWSAPGCAATLETIKGAARGVGAELWVTAQAPLGEVRPGVVPPPCDAFAGAIDVAICLEPHGSHVEVRLVKDHGSAAPADVHLELHCDTLRLVGEGEVVRPVPLPAGSFTLLSGGAQGAEAEFGACAERWGLNENTFTFQGRGPLARTRGLVELSDEELKRGEVSPAYVKAHMHRTYSDALSPKLMQSVWHQVVTAGEVFAVGVIQPDGTVRGGTGWAVELGRHWGRAVHVFDQEKKGWLTWKDGSWAAEAPPRITRERFAGTGTRSLTDEGRAAIQALFQRSFGSVRS